MERLRRWLSPLPVGFRRALVLIIGGTIVVVGILMLLLPGPGIAAIILGLAVLAIEFAWAERLLMRARQHAARALEKVRRQKKPAD
jgi:uncharacterized protein (TIGR02611 family)